jgi:hypothetical protein
MSEDHIRYDLLVREALRGVVRRVVADAARNGLPGEHHFFVSFLTKAPGVRISSRLHAQYPEEMTIVLQHQFWDLAVTDTTLEVGLSFNGIPEKLVVPFDAIKGFFDPSVKFGLEFEPSEPAEAADGEHAEAAPSPAAALPAPATLPKKEPVSGPRLRQGGAPSAAADEAAAAAGKEKDEVPSQDEPPKPEGGAEVVRLDRFRKK